MWRQRRRKKKGEVWSRLRPQQMLIRVGVGIGQLSARPVLREGSAECFVLGYEKTAQVCATGCLPRPYSKSDEAYFSIMLSPYSSFFILHSQTLTSCLQLTCNVNVLARLFTASYVKHSTDVQLTRRLFFVLTFNFLSVHTIQFFLELFHPKRASTLLCLKKFKKKKATWYIRLYGIWFVL